MASPLNNVNIGLLHQNSNFSTRRQFNANFIPFFFSEMRNWFERSNRKRVGDPVELMGELMLENPKKKLHKSMKYQNSIISIETKNTSIQFIQMLFISFIIFTS